MMNAGASESFSDMIKIMDLVIVVLIVSAGALAFVVLYNLIKIPYSTDLSDSTILIFFSTTVMI